MALKGLELKSAIEDFLGRVLEGGAKSAVMVNPEGFVLMSIGDYDEVDEAVAAFFVAAVPSSLRSLNEFSLRVFSNLLRKKVVFREKIIDQLQFEIEGRSYIGIYVEGYAIVANVAREEDLDRARVALVRAVASIIGLLKRLKESIAIPYAPFEFEEVPVREHVRGAEISVDYEKSFVDLGTAYETIRGTVLGLQRNIRERGDWESALRGFESLRNQIVALIRVHPELGDNNIIQAILRWLIKTESKMRKIVESGKGGSIGIDKREILERGLTQLVHHIRRILLAK